MLEGDWFLLDNQRVYDEFKALVLKGPGWGFIKTYNRCKDGRNAVLALCCPRKTSAYAAISNARYSGQKKTFPFARYVKIHQTAHIMLEELGEPVPETKKVTDFLAGITDPRLGNAKDTVIGNAAKLQNFEECQQYFQTLVFNKSTQEKQERNISRLTVENPKGNPKGISEREKGKKRGVTARSYSETEWKLSAVKYVPFGQNRKARRGILHPLHKISNQIQTREPSSNRILLRVHKHRHLAPR